MTKQSEKTKQPYRAFDKESWWNQPATLTRHADSDRWVQLLKDGADPWLKLTIDPDQAQPVYMAKRTDPLFTIEPDQGPTVSVHVPLGAEESNAPSPKLAIIDRSTDQAVGLFGASFSDGRWSTSGLDRYYLSSNGLHEDAGGVAGNVGHRGATMVTKAPRLDEVQYGSIPHKLQTFIPPVLVGSANVWPMIGSDGSNPDGIPEGVVMRIKFTVDLVGKGLRGGALVVATCLQKYGAMMSDGGSARAATIRMERCDWTGTGITKDSLQSLTWDDWEFLA